MLIQENIFLLSLNFACALAFEWTTGSVILFEDILPYNKHGEFVLEPSAPQYGPRGQLVRSYYCRSLTYFLFCFLSFYPLSFSNDFLNEQDCKLKLYRPLLFPAEINANQ